MDISSIISALNSLTPCIGHGKLLSQSNKDQGDTSQRVGALFVLLSEIEMKAVEGRVVEQHLSYDMSMMALQAQVGIYRRTNDPNYWGSNPNFMSRDQLSVVKLAHCMRDDRYRLLQTFRRAAGRLFFHQNCRVDGPKNEELGWKFPDIMAPSEWGVFARGLLGRASYFVTYFTDLAFAIDMIARKKQTWDYDNMLALNLIVAYRKYPTVWSKLAMKYYLSILPNVLERLANYHLDVEGRSGCPPLYYLFKAALEKIRDESR